MSDDPEGDILFSDDLLNHTAQPKHLQTNIYTEHPTHPFT